MIDGELDRRFRTEAAGIAALAKLTTDLRGRREPHPIPASLTPTREP
jgi:hypothetical protein